MEFLTEISTAIPEGTDPAEVDRRRAAEAVRARELAAAGHMVRLWRPVGEKRSFGLWRAADAAELDRVVATLPLHPWMTVTVTALEPHPNDPGDPGESGDPDEPGVVGDVGGAGGAGDAARVA